MDRLLTLAIEDSAQLTKARALGGAPLGLALAREGCALTAALVVVNRAT